MNDRDEPYVSVLSSVIGVKTIPSGAFVVCKNREVANQVLKDYLDMQRVRDLGVWAGERSDIAFVMGMNESLEEKERYWLNKIKGAKEKECECNKYAHTQCPACRMYTRIFSQHYKESK